MNDTVHELKTAADRWNNKMQLLEQLSRRLVLQNYDDTYESTITRTQYCLSEMMKIAEDFPGREPWGKGYREALDSLRVVLSQLENEDLKALVKAKQAAATAVLDAGWERVAEEVARRR